MFARNVNKSIIDKRVGTFGFKETNSFGKYPGVPLTRKYLRKDDFNYLIEKISNKLSNWKAKNLSFACRVTLSKSVMEEILVYPMMNNMLPKRCINEIQKLQHNFIWGDIELR